MLGGARKLTYRHDMPRFPSLGGLARGFARLNHRRFLSKSVRRFTVCSLLCGLLSLPVLAEQEVGIRTLPLSEIALYPGRSAPATVVSLNEATVSAQIDARVTELPVRVGDVVDAGALLATLDCQDYQLRRQAAAARLEALDARIVLAKRRVKRTERLLKKQSISEEALDERQADLAVLRADLRGAQADLEAAKLNESRCSVVSPFRALILERKSSVGDYATSGHPLIEILDLDSLEVSAQVFAQDARYVKDVEKFYFEQGGQRYPLTLRTVLPSINTVTRNREVRLLFESSAALPGAAGKLFWRDVRPHVPANLLVKRDGQIGVFTVSGDRAQFIATPTAQAGRASPVDLPMLTPLVIEGHLGLRDADQVEIQGDS